MTPKPNYPVLIGVPLMVFAVLAALMVPAVQRVREAAGKSADL